MGLGWPGSREGRRAYGCWPSASPGAGWPSSPPAPHPESLPSSRGQRPRPTPRPRGLAALDRHRGPRQKRRSKKGKAVLPPATRLRRDAHGSGAGGRAETLRGEGQHLLSAQHDWRRRDLEFLAGNHLAAGCWEKFPDSGQRGIGMGCTGRPAECPQPPVGLRAAP